MNLEKSSNLEKKSSSHVYDELFYISKKKAKNNIIIYVFIGIEKI